MGPDLNSDVCPLLRNLDILNVFHNTMNHEFKDERFISRMHYIASFGNIAIIRIYRDILAIFNKN